jgi:hypothetical protein
MTETLTVNPHNTTTSYDRMLDMMGKDGLINRPEGFKIKKKDGTLIINGHTQPVSVYEKYKRYLDSKNITIKGDDNNLSISINN